MGQKPSLHGPRVSSAALPPALRNALARLATSEGLRIHSLGLEHVAGAHAAPRPCPEDCPKRKITRNEADARGRDRIRERADHARPSIAARLSAKSIIPS